jgi:hypothetical protein
MLRAILILATLAFLTVGARCGSPDPSPSGCYRLQGLHQGEPQDFHARMSLTNAIAWHNSGWTVTPAEDEQCK